MNVPMPDAIRDEIETARAYAAIIGAPAVLAVLDRFNGKTINARLWNALTDAAKTVLQASSFSSPRDEAKYGIVARVHIWTARGGYKTDTIYNAPNTEREKTATGARLDAASVRADFERVAAEKTKIADQLEEQGARFGELVEAVRALGRVAKDIREAWRPEFLYLLQRDPVADAARLATVTRDDFRRWGY